METEKIGVLVVDDSAFMRKILSETINQTEEFHVVDTARDGVDALAKIEQYGPAVQVVTLDIQMPVMDGLVCLKHIMEKHPRRVVMVSSLTIEGAKETLEALELGAVDFFAKPGGAVSLNFKDVAPRFLQVLHNVARARLIAGRPTPQKARLPESRPAGRSVGGHRIVAVASSTGGPRALGQFIPFLPAKLNAAVLVVQHMPENFTRLLAERLNGAGNMPFKEAQEGDLLETGRGYIAPGGRHLEVTSDYRVHLTKDPPIVGLRPCADVTFRTVAPVFGRNIVGVVLTGMGQDGREGCALFKQKGCAVLAESKDTATIYGMPKAVVDAGIADRALPINDMAQAVTDEVEKL
jgi:two-component system, chemotaxis family, protein-glutamate methylesterase/glutaminase